MSILRHTTSVFILMEAAGWRVSAPTELYQFTEQQWEDAYALSAITELPQKIVAVGHRGTKHHAPENTIAAHEVAYAMGARAIEFDIRCTKDGHFIVIHDKKVDRTTNGSGKVKDMTLAQIKALDAGFYKGPKFAGEKVPTLREALRNVRGRFAVDIDFKGGPKNSAEIIEALLIEEGFYRDDAPLVTIFSRRQHFEILKPLSAKFALRPHYVSEHHTQSLVDQYPLTVMGLRRLSFSPKASAAIRKEQLHLFSNVMGPYDNEVGFEEARRAGSLFIQTDNLDLLVPFLKERDLLETEVLGRNYKPLKSNSMNQRTIEAVSATLH